MSDRFFVESPIGEKSATLTGQEAIHLVKVLRAKVGQELILFDGSGREFTACVSRINRHEVACEIIEARAVDREVPRHVALGVALPKGDRQRILVEKLTEIGVASLTPLKADRSVVQPDEQTAERLRRFVIEASKQCGRNRLMQIQSPCAAVPFFSATEPHSVRFIAHPSSEAEVGVSSLNLRGDSSRSVAIAIGPEGGFTDLEIHHAMQAGWQRIDLGRRVLRIETAAIVAAAIAAIPSE